MLIVAEIGSNFRDKIDCIHSIRAAKLSGADAVKFQYYSLKDLYGYGSSESMLPPDWFDDLAEECQAQGIEFMCTAFSREGVRFVNPYVKRHKLASSEMCHVELIQEIVATDKPVIVSMGGHTIEEIENSLTRFDPIPSTLLYCCNAYPSRHHNLNAINYLRRRFHTDVGYSDHSIDIFTPAIACRDYGAIVLEKHVTLDRSIESGDRGHSIDFDDFRDMVDLIKERGNLKFPKDIGNLKFPPISESDAVSKHNRRLVASGDVKKGDVLRLGKNFGIYRLREEASKIALSPFCWKAVEGSYAAKDLRLGEPIGDGDFQRADDDFQRASPT